MKNALILVACMWAVAASAQVQVVEAGEQAPSRSRNTAAAGGNSNELLVSLYNQLEALQQEVQNLRGMVEEQGHDLKRLESESRDRYLDIDRRLQSINTMEITADPNDPNAPISAAGVEPGKTVKTQVGDVRTTVPFNAAIQSSLETVVRGQNAGASVLPNLQLDNLSEQDLYRTALNLLLEEGNSADAAVLFQNYLERYPEGRLLPNALYWQGEAYILLARYPQAREAFERVLRDFSEDAKAAGSMLKLGVVFNLMGDRGLAEQTWLDLPLRFPDSTTEITLAKDYLDKR